MEIIKEARRFEKNIKKIKWKPNCKIAVLGSASIQYFVSVLRYILHNNGIDAEIYEGEYSGIEMDVFNSDSLFYEFDPDYVILLPYHADIKQVPSLLATEDEVMSICQNYLEYYENLWEKISEIKNVKILMSNFVTPELHDLGNLEEQCCFSKTSYIKRINDLLIRNKRNNVIIINWELLSCNIGKRQWFDMQNYFLAKIPFCLDYIEEAVDMFVNQIMALYGKTRKCLVLDLDNTLWGGVVGDEGYEGIQIGPENAVGESYLFFQKYILDLKQRGVILAVCSKNDECFAKEPFEKNGDMLMKLDDFACFIANWNDKASNLQLIAQKLNIGLDSLVFFDDNPAEREIIRKYLPEVYVVEVPEDPALYARQLDQEAVFEWLQLTKEDLNRNESYIENRNRQELQNQFVNYEEYLKALEMKCTVSSLTDAKVSRFTQLINKSNQFNLRTKRYTEDEIREFQNDENTICLYTMLEDKFSNYGIISCIILKIENKQCFIDTWVMSCRVLKRNVELVVFNKILQVADKMGCECIVAEYIATKKNAMVEKHYESLGFEKVGENENTKEYMLKLPYAFNDINEIQVMD